MSSMEETTDLPFQAVSIGAPHLASSHDDGIPRNVKPKNKGSDLRFDDGIAPEHPFGAPKINSV